MSRPDIVRGTYVSLLVETSTPGTFVALCGILTRRFTEQVNSTDVYTRDCNDPEDIPIRRLITTGKQWDLSGAGQYNRAQGELISSLVGVTKTYRFLIGEPAADAVYTSYFEGPAKLLQRQISGDDNDFANVELTLASDGAWAETAL